METGECHNPNGEAQNLTVKLNAPTFVFKIQSISSRPCKSIGLPRTKHAGSINFEKMKMKIWNSTSPFQEC